MTRYCRLPPSGISLYSLLLLAKQSFSNNHNTDFNPHQRAVFCVFSGPGVGKLRTHLNHLYAPGTDAQPVFFDEEDDEGVGAEVDDDDEDEEEETQED